MNDKLIGLEKEFNDEGDVSVFLKINMELLQKGLLRELTGNEYKVLTALALYIDDNSECYPSQETLSKVTGLAISTVSISINSLLKKKVEGKAIIKRRLIGTGINKYSNYTFPLLGEADTSSEAEERMTAPQVLKYFQDKYFEHYKVPYKANYKIDCSMIKKTLMSNFSDDQLKAIMDITIEEYDKRWRKPAYPSPTVGAICKWIGQEAIKLYADKQKATERVDKFANLETADEDLEF